MDTLALLELNGERNLLAAALEDLLVFVRLLTRLLKFNVVRPGRQPEVHLHALVLLEVALAVTPLPEINYPGFQVALPLTEPLDDAKLNRERRQVEMLHLRQPQVLLGKRVLDKTKNLSCLLRVPEVEVGPLVPVIPEHLIRKKPFFAIVGWLGVACRASIT